MKQAEVLMMSVEIRDDLVTLGKKFYEEKLKAILEPEHNGEFVAIEPYLGKYVVEKKKLDAILKARSEMPEKLFFIAKIGTIFTGSISHYVPKTR